MKLKFFAIIFLINFSLKTGQQEQDQKFFCKNLDEVASKEISYYSNNTFNSLDRTLPMQCVFSMGTLLFQAKKCCNVKVETNAYELFKKCAQKDKEDNVFDKKESERLAFQPLNH